VALRGRDRQSEAHGTLRGGLSMFFEDREASDWRERIAMGTDLGPGRARSFAAARQGSGDDRDSAGCGRWGALVCGAPGEVFHDAADQTRLGDEGGHAHDASAAGTDERIDLVDPSDELGPSAAQGGQSWGRWRRLLRRRQGH
jgi:hypothetical protein